MTIPIALRTASNSFLNLPPAGILKALGADFNFVIAVWNHPIMLNLAYVGNGRLFERHAVAFGALIIHGML